MKIIHQTIAAFFMLIFFTACVQEQMISVDPDFTLSFQSEGRTDASAGTPFYVIPVGSGEFMTLYDGTPGHVWGEVGAKGIDFNKADSMLVQYNDAGKYKLTVIVASSGNFGKDFSSADKTVEVNVVDERNTLSGFYINDVAGVITATNEILFTVPDIITDFKFIPVFVTSSTLATVLVNGVAQVSSVTENDFARPVVYTVKPSRGTEKNYTVKVTSVPSSAEKQITKFALGIGGNGEIGIINESTKTISISANYGTNLSAVRLVLESSYLSKILISNAAFSDRRNYDLLKTVKTIKVVAQNNSETEYKLIATQEKPVISFTFTGLIPAPTGIIDAAAKTISVDVLKGTDVTKLVAKWTGSVGKVTIGSTVQTSGVTSNNFTAPLTYTFYTGSTAGESYKVTVNVK